ncbi:MAG: YaiO family outer membrane beta-barrel protein [Brevundimonas sp.]|uniref:YaiO family outer membrane beta-barrel protein n=1 Tax=Brevundimonas sp. TaxID=1871086 RepID=UPI00248A5755|nr:YaiO family outer membrane beta-barrel protein [Brevundimonas sp.]MDI1326178.1 YaiO family outer membrane beta-barrel protein [Brevundimonas sp.]
MIVIAPEAQALAQADSQTLYRAAVADRRAGRAADAVAKLQLVLAARPDDVDARLNLGLALMALDRLDEAEAAFADVISRAPDYVDARVGLARVAQRRGDLATARRESAEASRLAPTDTEVAALVRSLELGPRWRLDIAASRSALSGGLPDWAEARIAVSRALGDRWNVALALEATERFDNRDTYGELRLDRRLDGGAVYFALGGAPDADYRPELVLGLGGQARLTDRLSATLDASAARYPTGAVTAIQPGVLVEIVPDRLQLAARWIVVRDETDDLRHGYALQSRWQASERVGLRLGYADAPESSEGFTVQVAAWNVGADIGLTDRLTLRVGAVFEDRGAYERQEASVGLGLRF